MLAEGSYRGLWKLVCSNIALLISMYIESKVLLIVINLMILSICQAGFICLDILNLRKYNRLNRLSRKERSELKTKKWFLYVRLAKNLLFFLNTVILLTTMESSPAETSKWLVAYIVMLIIYFIGVLYFIVSSGEVLEYLVGWP